MKRRYYSFLAVLITTSTAYAQPLFNTKQNVDVNKLKSSVLVHGDMWYDPATQITDTEFPAGTGKTLGFASALWMGGFNQAGFHAAAQVFRQSGTDYWPGMLPDVGMPDYQASEKWAKIWKVNKSDIATFLQQINHTVANTPPSILEWPAKGNIFAKGNNGAVLSITRDAAPFVDVNSDGIYNALTGDYPELRGDQMLWWVFNDNSVRPHEVTFTPGMSVEVQAMAYGYNRGTLIDNVVYYEYKILNRSNSDIDSFVAGIWNDCDLGYSHDDYIGFDSSRRLGFVYNGNMVDGQGEPYAYGANPPMAGITLISVPGDGQLHKVPAGSYMYYNNDNSVTGNPDDGLEYYNYLNARFRNGMPLPQGGPYAYALPNTECAQVNVPGDRRFVIALQPTRLGAGESLKIVWANVVTDLGISHSCATPNFTDIQTVTDTAWGRYYREIATSTKQLSEERNILKLYPNPTRDYIYLEVAGAQRKVENIAVHDAVGKQVNVPITDQSGKISFDVRNLSPGVYTISCDTYKGRESVLFVKD